MNIVSCKPAKLSNLQQLGRSIQNETAKSIVSLSVCLRAFNGEEHLPGMVLSHCCILQKHFY